MVLCSLFSALIAICSWLCIPIPPVSVTMQTFAVFLTLEVLGGKYGTASIVLYLLLGMVGLPVFAGFRGGAAALLDAGGGFLWGFGVSGLVYWMLRPLGRALSMTLGMLACYLCGCWWFTLWAGDAGWGAAVMSCVVPFLVPDGIKLTMAVSLAKRIRRSVKV